MYYRPDLIIKNSHDELLKVLSTTGVYVYKTRDTPIYIGKAVNLKARLLSHEQTAQIDPKEAKIVQGADTIELIYTDSEFMALVLEAQLISSYKPKYNIRWRDDKSYLYIKISIKEKFPKVSISRRENDGTSLYFGPFDSMRSVESLLRHTRRIVPFCTQKSMHKGACFYHKIGLCDPCPNLIVAEHEPDKKLHTAKYRTQIRSMIRILEGKTELVFRSLKREIQTLTKTQQYENAIQRRDALRQLEFLIMRGSFLDGLTHTYNNSQKSLEALKQILTPYFPQMQTLTRIECYDNSTLSFQNSTASMVVFTDGMVDKKEYRHFKLDTKLNNDFDMMKEVMTRRMRNTRWPMPDLIVIDGGKPQLLAVLKILNSKLEIRNNSTSKENADLGTITVIGLAKNPDRIVVGITDLPTIRPDRHHAGLRLLQHMRDEAHRFAKKYHTHLRNRAQMVQ